MEYRRLGKSGLLVSALSFGSWLTFGKQIGDEIAEKCMFEAYDAGVNFFDNAEAYAAGESEIVMGNILKKARWNRETYLVSSKVFWGGSTPNQTGLSRKHVIEACHAALKRLGVDYLDMYFCHRPDHLTPIEETVRAMSDLVTQGKVLYWGTSEWPADQIMEAYAVARQYHLVPPTMEQPQYNMFHRKRVEEEYLKLYEVIGMGTTIWSPLASGILTGKYNNGIPENARAALHKDLPWLKERFESELAKENIEKVKKLSVVANELGMTLPNLALAWCLKNQNVSTVIMGASKVEQLRENLRSAELVPCLTEDIIAEIETILDNKPLIPRFR